MNIEDNLILNFSQIYEKSLVQKIPGLQYIDVSDIRGTDLYCTGDAADAVRERLKPFSARGIHFIDSGNYHYATGFFAEKIKEPFALVLYDHHTDMQDPLFTDMITCGNWAAELLRKDSWLKQLILVGPEKKDISEIPQDIREKLVCISLEELKAGEADRYIPLIRMELPIYISIDKDVLDTHEARTNWNQGDMPVSVLEKLLLEVFENQQVIGVDICGECSLLEPLLNLVEDKRVNRLTNRRLYQFLSCLFDKKEG